MNNGSNITMISDLPELEDIEPKVQKHIRVHKPNTRQEQYHSQYQPQNIEPEEYTPPLPRKQPIYSQDLITPSPSNFNCIDIAKHVEQCPICSRFYHCDKTFYVVTIAVLIIICLMLLKKILDK